MRAREVRYGNDVLTPEFIERTWWPQERHHMAEMIPAIHAMMRTVSCEPYPAPTLSVLDAGARTGRGSMMLADLHPASDVWKKPALKVTALDCEGNQAETVSDSVEFRIANIFDLPATEQWDIVICSHVIEHIADPAPFVAELKRRARMFVLVYTPWKECALIPTHHRIDQDTLLRLQPDHWSVWPSWGWRHEHDDESDCLLQIFDVRQVKAPALRLPAFHSKLCAEQEQSGQVAFLPPQRASA